MRIVPDGLSDGALGGADVGISARRLARVFRFGAIVAGAAVFTAALIELPASGALQVLDRSLDHEIRLGDDSATVPFAMGAIVLTGADSSVSASAGERGMLEGIDRQPWRVLVPSTVVQNAPTVDGWTVQIEITDSLHQTVVLNADQAGATDEAATDLCADDTTALSEAELLACPFTAPARRPAQTVENASPAAGGATASGEVQPLDLRPL